MLQSYLKKFYCTLSLFLVCLVLSAPVFAEAEIRYNKYNIHTQTKDGVNAKASYANYIGPYEGHIIVPPGTKLVVTKKSRKSFTFTYNEGQKVVTYEFHKSRMGMELADYLELITSAKPVSPSGLSKVDKQGVTKGQALVGMSREGVKTALGYPAKHRTPSLEDMTWVYWKDRFRTVGVDFDASGKVKAVR